MCFSAAASFGASIVLTTIGVASIKATREPRQLLFASIPLIFGIQQIAEGILWTTLPHSDFVNTQKIFTYIFLFIAQVIWPIWVPISILLLEKNATRINIQKILVGAGIVVGIYLGYCLMTYEVEAKIVGQHITYIQAYPLSLKNYGIILYGFATILPPFFSHIRSMNLFGTAVVLSYTISAIFYDHYVLSVWCFFAAIVSLSIYAIIVSTSKAESLPSLAS